MVRTMNAAFISMRCTCVCAQLSTCCFLDTEGLVPPMLLQLDGLLSTCPRCQLRLTCTVGAQWCMHVSDLLACGGGLV
jgi:hypothetical protein